MPSITLIVCGAPLTRRVPDLASTMLAHGWSVTLVGTPASVDWLDPEVTSGLTGTPLRVDFRRPAEGKQAGEPDLVALLPATFNTMNKLASGIADNYATSVACSWLGERKPLLIAPMVNQKLWGHAAFSATLRTLSESGARFLDIQTGSGSPTAVASGTGEAVAARFEPLWLVMASKEAIDPHPTVT